MSIEPLPNALQADHLTEALRRAGVLGDALVRDVTVQDSTLTVLSRIIRLRLDYDGAAPDAPASVIVKTGHPDRIGAGSNGARQEVTFYTRIAPEMGAGLVPRCFEAV